MLCVYLIGVPGSGKTTVMDAVTGALQVEGPLVLKGLTVTVYAPGTICQLGRPRARFGGTDTLGLGVAPHAIRFMESRSFPTVLGEGDRLAYPGFLDAARNAGYDLRTYWLDCPEPVAEARRRARGSTQDETWLRGRRTKVERLVARETPYRLDAGRTPADLAAEIAATAPLPWRTVNT